MQDNILHNFMGGMDMTNDYRVMAMNTTRFAQDVEYYDDGLNSFAGVRPMKSTLFSFDIGNIVPQPQINRLFWNRGSAGTNTYNIYRNNGFITTINVPATDNITAAISAINSALTAAGITNSVTIYLSTNYFFITFTDLNAYTIKQSTTGVFTFTPELTSYILQEAYNYTAFIEPLQSIYINEVTFFFSRAVDHDYCELGGVSRDVNGIWTYIIIASSSKLNFPTDEVIDARIELRADGRYSLYYTDNTNKPKVIYFPVGFANASNSAMRYAINFPFDTGNPDGIYLFDSINEQTNLQLVNNNAVITFTSQINNGGALTAGSKRYAVRFGIYATNNTTPFSYLSGDVIVYSESANSKNAGNIKGDTTPAITSKINVLTISNANPDVFGYAEVACVEYQGGAVSASIIGRFVVTADEFTITHTGNEIGATLLDVAAIPNVTPIITKAKNLEIKKNRENLAAVELAVDEDLVEISKNITVTWQRTIIDNVGALTPVSNLNLFSAINNGFSNVIGAGENKRLKGSALIYPTTPPFYWDPSTGLYTVDVVSQGITSFSFRLVLLSTTFDRQLDCNIRVQRIRGADTTVIFSVDVRPGTQVFWVSPNYTFKDASQNGDLYELVLDNNVGKFEIDCEIDSYNAVLQSSSVTSYKDNLKTGEYNDPNNVANKMAYMDYETYAFFIRYHYTSGYVSNPYFIRLSQCPLNILTNNVQDLSIHNPVFSNINIAGLKDKINGFSICRALCNPTVVARGVYIPSHEFAADGAYVGQYASLPNGESATTVYGHFVPNTDTRRYFGAFFSSDLIFNDGLNYNDNDKLIVFSQASILDKQNNIQGPAATTNGSYVEYLGDNLGSIDTYNIEDAQYVKYDGVSPNFTTYSKYLKNNVAGLTNRIVLAVNYLKDTMFQSCYAITTDLKVARATLGFAPFDYGVYSSLIYRAVVNQYDIDNVNIVDCNHFYNVTPLSPDVVNSESVFGGDVYTQKVYMRVCSNAQLTGQGTQEYSFISFYTQNRINFQMRHSNPATAIPLFPADAPTLNEYLFPDIQQTGSEVFAIDAGYNQADNKINIARKYNEHTPPEKDFPARIYYSEQKPTGSIYDSYRDIKPLDFHDLEAKNGQIVALYDVDNQMMAVQAKAITKLPYQSDVLLKSDSGAEIYIGNGGVYAQRETIISTFGSNIKSCVYSGFNKNGNATLYWLSTYYRRLMKYNYDGIKTISFDAKLRNFFLNNLSFVTNEFDVIIGYDIKRDNLWITARTQNKTYPEWDGDTTYETGGIVKVSNKLHLSGFELLPDIYVSQVVDNNDYFPPSFSQSPDIFWQLIPHSNNKYYNEWTLLYNETLNVFTTTTSVLPKRFFIYKDDLLIPRGIPSNGRVYQLNAGDTILQWLDEAGVFKQGTFIIEPVFNKQAEATKSFLSLGVNTGDNNVNNPSVLFSTKTQTSLIQPTDFEQENSMIWTAVGWDVNGDGIQGEYLVASIQTQQDIVILDVINKIYYRPRNINK